MLTDPADFSMIKFVEKMTLAPATMSRDDAQGLRDVGFDDLQILEIAALCAQFNYVARMADALGIELEEHYSDWSKFLGFKDGSTIEIQEYSTKGDPWASGEAS